MTSDTSPTKSPLPTTKGTQLSELAEKRERMLEIVSGFESCAVAFSAGVDSTVVAKAAQLALGDRAVAVTGVSPSLAESELEEAHRLAALIGIRHEVITTDGAGSDVSIGSGSFKVIDRVA